MKRKYKKFLKAAYIDYEEDYCSNAVLRKTRPSLEEILAPATFEITANYADGYYWTTFYTSMANYLAPDGVLVLKVNFNGSQFIRLDVEDGIINKRQGVVLRSSTSSITLTKTYSKSSDDYSNNSLIGTDYLITNPGNAYVLNYGLSHGLSFYRLSSTGRIKANKAYLIMPITYLTQWKIVGNSEVHTLPYPDGVVLPNGYKRCEYLQSDGAVYIELPYGFEVTDDIYIKCVMSELVDWGGVIASKTWDTSSNKRFTFGGAVLKNSVRVFTSSFGLIGPAGGVLSPQVIADTDIHEWTYANYQITIDNSASKTYSDFGTGGSTDSLRIFYGYDRPRKYRIYDYRHTKGDTEYHLIPCLDSNDTPCMYDVINNQAYYNSAESGSFTYKLYPQQTEIWSCGEYNATDGKYHILVQPLGGSIADIALTEPLRKVNDVADTIEFPSDTEGKALVTRYLASEDMGDMTWGNYTTAISNKYRCASASLSNVIKRPPNNDYIINILSISYGAESISDVLRTIKGIGVSQAGLISVYDDNYNQSDSAAAFTLAIQGVELIYQLYTPTTELIDAPQIEEAESYSMVISQGGKAVEWSGFTTE